MSLVALPWIVLFLPLAAAAVITLFTRRNRELSAGLSIAAVIAGFILSIIFIGTNALGTGPGNCGDLALGGTIPCRFWSAV